MGLTGREKAIAILGGERFDTPALYACITSDPLVEALTGKKVEKENGLEVLGEAYRGHVDAARIFAETIEPYWDEGEYTDDRGFVRRRERWTEWCRRRPYANADELAAFIKDDGIGVKLIFHSDGDLREILPELAATGIDGLNPIETSAGLTLENVRELAGDELLLVGGIPNDVLVRGTPDDVRACVRELVRQMKGTPWWAGTSTEEFDESMPVENALVVIEETGHAI